MEYPFLALGALVLSSTYSPGPNNLMSMALGKQLGFKRAYKYALGAYLGYVTLLTLIAIFNGIIYRVLPSIIVYIGALGALYLCYLAWNMVRAKRDFDQKERSLIPEERLFVTAFFLQFINPKGTIFGLTILSTFAFPYFQDAPRIALLIGFLMFNMICSLSLWMGLGTAMSHFIAKYEKPFNIVMALALLYCAYAISGLDKLIAGLGL